MMKFREGEPIISRLRGGTRIPNCTFLSKAQTAFSCAGLICWHGQEPLLGFLQEGIDE